MSDKRRGHKFDNEAFTSLILKNLKVLSENAIIFNWIIMLFF